jgi:hypothetical protein
MFDLLDVYFDLDRVFCILWYSKEKVISIKKDNLEQMKDFLWETSNTTVTASVCIMEHPTVTPGVRVSAVTND